ncbi:MAG TPA: ABC transporter permease [Actinomycetota bacterium]
MTPIVRRALLRGAAAFLVTFVVGSGVVFAVESIGRDGGPTDGASPPPTTSPDAEPDAVTPEAALVWVPGGFPDGFAEELTTIRPIRRAAVATAGVAWLTASTGADGDVVDDPAAPYMVPLDTTGVDVGLFSSFVPEGAFRDLVRDLGPSVAILSRSAARLRGLDEGATLTLDPGIELVVIGTLPDVLVGGHELLVTRPTAERLGAGLPRYALLRLRAAPVREERLRELLEGLLDPLVREPLVELRMPGTTELLRANDRALPPIALKRRFGEFTAFPDAGDDLDIDPAWVEEHVVAREVPRLGLVECHERLFGPLRKAMKALTLEASLGDVGPCFDGSWRPDLEQGTLPASLWGASIHLNTTLNSPGTPPLIDARIVETMRAFGFRWGGDDAYPDGGLFEFLGHEATEPPASPTDGA